MIPEEDKYLCEHDWRELNSGSGIAMNDPKKALAAFYCRLCLEIRIKSYSQGRYFLDKEFLEKFKEDNGEGVI